MAGKFTPNQRCYLFTEPVIGLDTLLWILDGDGSALVSVHEGNLLLLVSHDAGIAREDLDAWEAGFLDSAHLKGLIPKRFFG